MGHQSASVDFNRPGRLQGPSITSNLFTDPYDPNFAQGRNSPVNEVTDYLTKVNGKHTLKFGANMRLTEQWGYNLAGTSGGIYPNVTTATTLGNTVPATIGPTGTSISSANRTTFEKLYNDVLGRMNQVVQSYFSDLNTFQAAGSRARPRFQRQGAGLLRPGRLEDPPQPDPQPGHALGVLRHSKRSERTGRHDRSGGVAEHLVHEQQPDREEGRTVVQPRLE